MRAQKARVSMKIDKVIERLRKVTAVRAAHLEENCGTRDLTEDGLNASAKREALKLLNSAVLAKKEAKVAA
jgi:hypothetical protein